MNFKEFYTNFFIKESLMKHTSSLSDLQDHLVDNEWEAIGSGSYGTVYKKAGKDYVLKAYDDECYNQYLDFIEQNQNDPHVVKIKRRIIKNNIGLVAIEKLEEFPRGHWIDGILSRFSGKMIYKFDENVDDEELINLFQTEIRNNISNDLESMQKFIEKRKIEQDYIPRYIVDTIKRYKKELSRLSFAFENHLNEIRTLIKLKRFLINHSSDCSFDLHVGNFLRRPSTGEIIITDPIYK
jgi:hypothetical protein